MFHLNVKPNPPRYVGRETIGQAVDSSAMVTAPGTSAWITALASCKKRMAGRFSLPPYSFGIHSPSLRPKSR